MSGDFPPLRVERAVVVVIVLSMAALVVGVLFSLARGDDSTRPSSGAPHVPDAPPVVTRQGPAECVGPECEIPK